LSPLGNIAAATCDTWSNESVKNLKLLGGMAPTCYLEQLIYDCRLMNQALADGREASLLYRKWMVDSDAGLDPQAYVLTPTSAIAIARAIVRSPISYEAGKAAALTAWRLMREAHEAGALRIHPREVPWSNRIQCALEALPALESQFIADMMAAVDTTRFVAADYGL
jgi:methanol--5-hydroxybenzimidazolylcobamide Co-methyltransferase